MRIEWIENYMKEAQNMIMDDNVNDGLQMLDRLLYDEPGYGSLHNHLGWAYMYYTSDSARAELHFKMAIRFDASFGPSYLHLAALNIRIQRYDDAIAIARQGLNVQGTNKVALLEQIAMAYELKKEYANAIRNYKEALVSTAGSEGNAMNEGIRRCRKKRLAMMFSF